jgi:uncharacterized membrane protein YkvA (DUF1232 family)
MSLELTLAIAAICTLLILGGLLLLWRRTRRQVRLVLDRIGALPWRDKLALVVALMREERLPLEGRAVLPVLVLYLALPLDVVPDVIPVIGQLDDAVVAIVAVTLVARAGPRALLEEHIAWYEGGRRLALE